MKILFFLFSLALGKTFGQIPILNIKTISTRKLTNNFDKFDHGKITKQKIQVQHGSDIHYTDAQNEMLKETNETQSIKNSEFFINKIL